MTRFPQSNAARGYRVVAAGWAKPNKPGGATGHAVSSVDGSRNTGIDHEADELAAAVANLNEELARA
jgi:hypothetical protein